MSHKLLTGSFHPDLETALRDSVHTFRALHPPLTPLPILVPSNLLKVYLRRRLVELNLPHIALEFLTLQQLIARLASAPPQPKTKNPKPSALPPFADELLADAVIEKHITRESYFERIRHAAGFRASLLESFRDLKEAGIAPDQLTQLTRRSPKLSTPKFRELAALYHAYTDALAAANVEDDAEKLARAAASPADPFPDRTDVFLYGFYDFNYLQRRLIARIAARHPLTVFFPYHPSESADQLHIGGAYLYAEPTLRWFESLLDTEAEPFFAEENPLPETLLEFRARLFNQSRTPLPNASEKNLLILSAPHEPAESRELLRESLAACAPKHAPNAPRSTLHEIAILPRQSQPYASLIADTAAARAIPVHNAAGAPLIQNIAARAYLALLDTARTNLGRAAAMEFATLAPLDPTKFLPADLLAGFNPAEWDRLSAALGIVRFTDVESNSNRLTAHLNKLNWRKTQTDPDDPDATQTDLDREIQTTRALGIFVRTISQKLRSIFPAASEPKTQNLKPSAPSWSHLLKTSLAAFTFFVKSEDLDKISAALAPLAELDAFQPTVTLDTFIRYARKSLESESIRETQFEDGGIFIGGVMAARGLTWRTVILPGLVEKTFPRVVREDPILLDADRIEINSLLPDDSYAARQSVRASERGERLADAATLHAPRSMPLRLDLKLRGLDEERLLFQLACESAREKLILTFPRLEPATGRPRVPSMLVLQAVEAITGKSLALKNLSDCALFREIRLNQISRGSGVPPRIVGAASPPRLLASRSDASAIALDATELHLAQFQSLRAQRITRIAPLLRVISPTLEHGLRAHRARWGEHTATIYDGIFADKSALDAIAKLLAPDARHFSPTAFEKFAWCPRCYFEEKILGIADLDEPEDTVMLPPLELGSLVHKILQRVVADWMREKLCPLDPALDREHWQRLEKIAAEEFAKAERNGFTGIPLLWEIQRARILAVLRDFLDDEYEQQAEGLLPRAVEWSFGEFRDFDEESANAISVKLPSGETLTFHGKVDRVDEHAEKHWRVVTDYKTGKPPKITDKKFTSSPLNGGQLLQIPIYALAARTDSAPVTRGEHIYLFAEREEEQRLVWNTEMLKAAHDELPKLLATLHELMSRGVFFQQGDCKRCGGSALSQGAVQWLYDLKHEHNPVKKREETTR
jgi:superfamily I DNA/RNA helicase/RecB family exonuclease